jgi:hypothetical protein
MEELSEIHLLPEELEEYSKLSRIIKLLKRMRLESLRRAQEEEYMKAQQGIEQVQPVAPTTAGLNAAPVQPPAEPLKQTAMPKPVNAKLEPLMSSPDKTMTRTASAPPGNPFERMLQSKFAALATDGTPTLEEATGIGMAGLAGQYFAGDLARMGSGWQAREALGKHLHGIEDYLNNTRASRNQVMSAIRSAATENKLKMPSIFWNTDAKTLAAAKNLEMQMAKKITKAKIMPLRVMGGLGAALGAASLIRNMTSSPSPEEIPGG